MTTPVTKIVIVSGQEFSVPAETDNEAIRTQLAGMGFADVASATIQMGKRQVEGQDVQTIEFVKKAGTKGLDGAELAALLASLPAAALAPPIAYGPSAAQTELLLQLRDGELTFADVVSRAADIKSALDACYEAPPTPSKKGAQLCISLDQLVAVPCSAPVVW